MARRPTRRRTGRSGFSSARTRSSARRTGGRGRASGRPQTVKIVIETQPSSPVSRGFALMQKPAPRRARY